MSLDIKKNFRDRFVLFTILTSLVLGLLYLWKGFDSGYFSNAGYAVIGMNFLYVPFAIVFARKGFPFFYLIYSGLLIFSTAFESTYLYNNYTSLFIVCIVIMIQPKLRNVGIVFYFSLITVAFVMNEEKNIYLYFIHAVRSIWYIGLVEFVLNDKFKRKKLVLYEDERMILEQLAAGKVYQKEVEGFSENTIYRKLKAARERNGNLTRDKLVEEFRNEQEVSV